MFSWVGITALFSSVKTFQDVELKMEAIPSSSLNSLSLSLSNINCDVQIDFFEPEEISPKSGVYLNS